ncbi:MAG: type 4a pilus biogenesis protein PilO [Candidatus Omnitrophota bacterium]
MINMLVFYNFLSRLSKREKSVLYISTIFISLALIDRLIVSPIYAKVTSLGKDIKEKEASIKRNIHMLAQKERIEAERTKYSSYIQLLESSDDDVTSLLKEVERLANEASVYLIDIKPAGLKKEEGYSKLLVKLNCEAPMADIAGFMHSIESSDSLLTVESYKIGPKGKGSDAARCSMSISRRVKAAAA